jgi:nicotinic acid mononucleotide adenylyltransferase
MSRVVFTFGRFNPPTIGHEKLIEAVAKQAGSDDYKIFTSHSQDKKKNPLKSDVKVEWMKLMFPKHASSIQYDTTIKTPINVLQHLQGTYTDIVMVVGSDRVPSFESMLHKYNGVEYTFRNIEVVSAGERDPDADGAAGMSASKMRAAAEELDTKSFRMGIPETLDNEQTAKLMLDVRKGMGL